jgi:hypothetical protein
MGNKASAPASTPPTPAVVRPAGGVSAIAAPMDTVTQCRVKNVELSQLQNDITKKQTEIDTCDPTEANRRRTATKLQEYNSFISEKEKLVNELKTSIESNLSMIKSVYTASKPTRSYIQTLTSEANTLSRKKLDFEQAERTQRRAFLDNGPQDGVSGLLGIRTHDDKVLFAFWITYGVALASILYVFFLYYGTTLSTAQKLQISGGVLFVAYGIAYYFITRYG